mmetsp:Transcript_11835/g.22534  ORF Transcript_11835/g.22534 Transcript_11835/m.22534 type:complete len:206 (-) Transcript_11835:334-951(-)|eukprot:CAMPEP_0114250768 /NCGR_PEP_ID=MMETSP0058-20121206/14883_1 /TAXON_ID=36894 /ORGANISM="Pyramimonas parkeae, CCMP726" /LENGTH=205 /DNA_ID=CAMNT_0001364465 /DNA_START=195 /DNA_END=812 /DNA_ORIENTATION=+
MALRRSHANPGRIGQPLRNKPCFTEHAAEHSPNRLQNRNERGGILIHEEEIKDAFQLLNLEGRENLSREDMQYFMDTYFPGMLTHKEIKSLIGPNGMKFEKLRKLLVDNDLVDFDPCAEAFKVLDPEGSGEIDLEILSRLIGRLPGMKEVTREDLEFIMMHMDNDKDGSIGLEDFAKVGNYDDLGRDDNAPSREPGTSGATIHTV